MQSLAQPCKTLQNRGNPRLELHSGSLQNYVIALQNYVTLMQNYVTHLQNYVIPLHNYVKPCKTVEILDQDRVCGSHCFSKIIVSRHCAPIVQVLRPAEKSVETLYFLGGPAICGRAVIWCWKRP